MSKTQDFSSLSIETAQTDQPRNLADAMNAFFVGVSSDIQPLDDNVLSELSDDYCDDFIVEPSQVLYKLEKINCSKSSGPDDIPNWFLKELAPFLANPICAIYNASIREGTVCNLWKTANVTPVPKQHPPKNIQTDLRPISVTATLIKILESFVGNWILDKLVHTLDQNQFGSLNGRSTTHALVQITNQWCKALDSGGSVRAVFVDYTKAFDRIDHNLLLNKLLSRGIPHCLVRWIFSFLKDRRQRVKLNDTYSDWATLQAGMPQGTWLGPLCFIVMIDDLNLTDCLVCKYVDDTTLSEVVPRSWPTTRMQEHIDELTHWSTENKMLINSKKTKEMLFGPLAKTAPALLASGSGSVEQVTTFKLLGVHISNTLQWECHVEAVCSKAASRLYFLKQLKRAGLQSHDLLYFYITCIRPILEYACIIWHHGLTAAQSDRLESLQKRALRIIYSFTPDSSYHALMEEANLVSLHDRRIEQGRTFFHHMCNPHSCLHYLLPPKRNAQLLNKLRNANKYPLPLVKTKRYCSYLQYALHKYQE
jgi:hypothetical protein